MSQATGKKGREHLATLCVHEGGGTFQKRLARSVSTPETFPVYAASVYAFDDIEALDAVYDRKAEGYIYSRMAAPNADAVSGILARADGGEAALVLPSGMAAITATILASTQAGEHIISSRTLYGGVHDFFANELERRGVEVTFLDMTRDAVEAHIKKNTRLLYTEMISNPLMEVADVAALSATARRRGLLLFVDNTFATPAVARPLDFGADAVLYSATKYLGGHSDIVAGAVVANRAIIERVKRLQTLYGFSAGAHDCWLLARSLRTLDLRMGKHSDNALKVARFLQKQAVVDKVFYPGLPSSPSHGLARRQFAPERFGGMLSADLKGGAKAVKTLLKNLRTIRLVPSLAGVATSISVPVKTSHRAYDRRALKKMGIIPGQIRFSVGLEEAEDILAELEEAFSFL
ncbi:MAG: aminotransferase class I/II-fold pyridoxal phosphate-dependent enzyme [Desulfovibrio sp.]|jgi:methionine-gamma-lyase|nr:aminotransferase class I/II-fold pyridoxal phosphate-dependent enzyme [Desulfovibrio sp.]